MESNLRAMIEDSLETPTIQEWPIRVSVDDVLSEMRKPTFAELFDALHRLYARPRGKERWGEKSPRDSFYMAEIKFLYPDAQFIHILRDGRDVAIDLADSILWPNTIYAAAFMWRDFVNAITDSAEELDSGCYHIVRYEELCAEPEVTLRRLCNYLEVDFCPEMLIHNETESTKTWSGAAIHGKTAKPINTDFVEMYKTRLNDRDRAVLEGVIGDTLQTFDYSIGENSVSLSAREARQLLENDTISNTKAIQYKRWHEGRRKERHEREVWKDSDRDSLLLGFY